MVPNVIRLNNNTPVIKNVPSHLWENKVTFNPACALISDSGTLRTLIPQLPFDSATKRVLDTHAALCFLLYRAQGRKTETYDFTRSSIGLAILTPDLQLLARHPEPVLLPDTEYDNLGVEDPRITKMGDTFVMVYTAYSTGVPDNRIRIALATSTDFVHWEKHGLLKGDFNELDNKNAMLLPGHIDGKLLMFHRPMAGVDAMSIHWAEGEDLFGVWKSKGSLMKPRPNPEFVDTWIGGGAPPLCFGDHQYLVLYHIGNRKKDGTREYDLGIALLTPHKEKPLLRREEPLLRPSTPAETSGDAELGVNNVVFICGAYFHEGDLYFPYAGADSVVLGGKIGKEELQRWASER